MNVLVETAKGTACICGDVLYDIQNIVGRLHNSVPGPVTPVTQRSLTEVRPTCLRELLEAEAALDS